ncbi:hypothetical protein ALC57_15144 [Trachymyrmex cornetzi]|uniref:Uncharacterized protein n=1 Tax=Trachymyrmex cornetzi TaxID=471704 RepID=A0A151IXA1_9HYME|nr:hypothetical protein ALC57_15144 [Trachymyrmex cornetzi]
MAPRRMTRVQMVRHKMTVVAEAHHKNQRVGRRNLKVVDHKNQMVLRPVLRRTMLVVHHTVSSREAYGRISSTRMTSYIYIP